ncbi:MAG: hypothetical protein HYR62_08445 [Actinobacteria bacterium]|nr:hypothetical protein [Actinomycetota bacterium]MBI3686224.1 hypothetical protein [Actinomycetota bacterium]
MTTSRPGGNDRLRQAMHAAGLSNKALARAVRQLAARHGDHLATDHTTVARWLTGTNPRESTLDYILEAISARLGTPLDAEDLGFLVAERVAADLGLRYLPSLHDSIGVLAELTRLDATQHPTISASTYSADAVHALCLDWLFGESTNDLNENHKPVRATDVDELRMMTATFDHLDRRGAGEEHRQLAVRYLHDIVVPKLGRAATDPAGRDFLQATAILCELIGWMAFDTLHHATAQRYFSQAIRFAEAAGDQGYAAFAVASMADQALFVGQPTQALRLAQVAGDRSGRTGHPVTTTEAHVLRARAYATLGEVKSCSRALTRAERTFNQLDGTDHPTWAAHWTEYVLSSHAGTCWTDLGQVDEASRQIGFAWRAAQHQPRRLVYNTVQLGRIALLRHDVEEACHYLGLAEENNNDLLSERSAWHVTRLRDTLTTDHGGHTAVRQLRATTPQP